MFFDLFINISIISALLFVAGQFFKDRELTNLNSNYKILIGFGSGILGIFLMIYTVNIGESIIVDLRHISIIISAIYGGPISSLITSICIAFYRLAAFGVSKASVVASCNALLMGVLCAIFCRLKLKPILKYIILNFISISLINLSFLILVSNSYTLIKIMGYFNLISIAGAIFTYFLCSYIDSSNSNYREMKYYRIMTYNLADLISTHDLEGKLIYVSPSCQSLLGYTPEELYQLILPELIYHEDFKEIFNLLTNGTHLKEKKSFEYRIKCKNGDYKWLESSVKAVKNKDGFLKEYVCVSKDISLRKSIEEMLKKTNQRLSALFTYAGMGIVLKDMSGKIIDFNPTYKKILNGIDIDSLKAHSLKSDLDKELVFIEQIKSDEMDHCTFEKKYFNPNGEIIHVEITITKLPATLEEPPYLIYMIRDITQQKQLEDELKLANAKLKSLSFIDGLTRIPNRRYFDEYLMEQWEACKNAEKDLSMLLLDIDYFKAYNDTYGHLEGDECLKLVAKTLVDCLDNNLNIAFRYGGEEFVIVLPGVSAKENFFIAEKIRSTIYALKIPNINSMITPYVTISIGAYTVVPTENTTPLDFVEKVDKLLYKAKSQGRNRVCT